MKNEKFQLDIQTKCGHIANEILNATIDTEQTFKSKWPQEKKKVLSKEIQSDGVITGQLK